MRSLSDTRFRYVQVRPSSAPLPPPPLVGGYQPTQAAPVDPPRPSAPATAPARCPCRCASQLPVP